MLLFVTVEMTSITDALASFLASQESHVWAVTELFIVLLLLMQLLSACCMPSALLDSGETQEKRAGPALWEMRPPSLAVP